MALNPPLQKHEPLTGLFLCAKSDQAFFGSAIFQLGSNPVETPGNFTAIIGVLVAVESFEEEHPLVSAEMNGFRGRWISHEWIACSSFESFVRFYQWSQASAGSAPINHQPTNLENHHNHPFSDGR